MRAKGIGLTATRETTGQRALRSSKPIRSGLLGSALLLAACSERAPGIQEELNEETRTLGQALSSVEGEWTPPICWPLVAIHIMQLHTGKYLTWPHRSNDPNFLEAWLWDPKPGCFGDQGVPDPNCFERVDNSETNLFCVGHAALADGQILTTGGHSPEFGNLNGLKDANLFDPESQTWTGEAAGLDQLDFARWYPTSTTLSDGTVLTVGGSQRLCNGGDLAGEECHANVECPGEVSPGVPATCEAFEIIDVPELFDPDLAMTSNGFVPLSGAPLSLPLYPHMHLLPDGTVFFAGAEGWDPASSIAATDARKLDVATQVWSAVATSTVPGASSAMYEAGKILKVGGVPPGTDMSVAGAEVIDLSGSGGGAGVAVESMAAGRIFSNLTLLPDQTVMVSGGTRRANREYDYVCEGTFNECSPASVPPGKPGLSCPGSESGGVCEPGVACVGSGTQYWVSEVEIFDPATNEWTPMAPMATPRQYHSATMLLPDGRVVSSGGGQGGGAIHNYSSIEIFSPPYLFKGARPTVTSAPEAVDYGQDFSVETPDAADIAKATLIRLGVTTHGFDQNTRMLPLTFVPGTGSVEITGTLLGGASVPLGPTLAPPGYYLLFLVNSAGVPAIGRYIRIGDGPIALCEDRAVSTDPGTCGAASVSIDAGSFDPGGSAITLSQTPPGPYAPPETTVVLTVTDAAGLTDKCQAQVVVEDNEPPAFTSVPEDVTTSICGSLDIGLAVAEDACSGAASVTNDAPAVFPPGTTLVTWTATDAEGNAITATQRVTVMLTNNPACCPAGTNVVMGTSSSNNPLNGTSGSDCIFALGGQDVVNGFGGNDYISAGDGNDVVNAGSGNDTVFLGSGQDSGNGGDGDDTLHGNDGDDTLTGGIGNDLLSGGQGQDTLQGQDGSDRLFGDVGFDNLQGGNGDDTLVGGDANDTCNGGAGVNTFAQCEFGAPNSCTDGSFNGTETDLDCGGACPGCEIGDGCITGADCDGGVFCLDDVCALPPGSTPNLVETELTFTTDWGSGYCAVLNVTNNATEPTTSFTITFDTNQATIYDDWGGTYSAASGVVTLTPTAALGVLDPDETEVEIGFCANRNVAGSGTLPFVIETVGIF
jgi:hypothetical protein